VNRPRFFAFAFGSLAVCSLAMTVAVLVAPAASAGDSAASRYGVVNATVNAATVHDVAGSTAFPNFTTGAVDNYYSMAHSAVDNSPFAEGTASPFDTGPIGQTAAAGHFQQPQYADARWPDKNLGKASYGNPGGPHAVATAASYNATAQCSEASSDGGASPPGIAIPKADSRKLGAAIAAWKAKWAVPLKLKMPATGSKPKVPVPVPSVPTPTVPTPTVPTLPTPTVSVPLPTSKPSSSTKSSSSNRKLASASGDGGALLESSTLATVDPGSGNVITTGESRLGRVSLGKGQIVIHGIDVTVTVTNSGTPTGKVAVNVGAASIGGIPVTIDQDGVHVKGQGPNLPYAKADDSLNAALKKAGIQLHTVEPEITKLPNEQTIIVSGVHVGFVQPVDAPGVPSQYVDHIIGEVFVDSLAVPAPPIPKLDLSGGPGSSGSAGSVGSGSGGSALGGSGSGSAGFSSGGGTSSGYSSQPGSGGSAAQAVPVSSTLTSLTHKPVWLLAAYLVWQTLVIGTGISLRYWGMGRPS
jgi:uncharacterized membrane protein YgcG